VVNYLTAMTERDCEVKRDYETRKLNLFSPTELRKKVRMGFSHLGVRFDQGRQVDWRTKRADARLPSKGKLKT
jgi:hypothetical protein